MSSRRSNNKLVAYESAKDALWMKQYKVLKKYHRTYNTFYIPTDDEEYKALKSWIKTQRYNYNKNNKGLHSHLTDERIQMLNQIGFPWSPRTNKSAAVPSNTSTSINNNKEEDEYSITTTEQVVGKGWMKQFYMVKQYYKKYNTFVVPADDNQNKGLRTWMKEQRRNNNKNKCGLKSPLTNERYQMLHSIQFPWYPKRHKNYDPNSEEEEEIKVLKSDDEMSTTSDSSSTSASSKMYENNNDAAQSVPSMVETQDDQGSYYDDNDEDKDEDEDEDDGASEIEDDNRPIKKKYYKNHTKAQKETMFMLHKRDWDLRHRALEAEARIKEAEALIKEAEARAKENECNLQLLRHRHVLVKEGVSRAEINERLSL